MEFDRDGRDALGVVYGSMPLHRGISRGRYIDIQTTRVLLAVRMTDDVSPMCLEFVFWWRLESDFGRDGAILGCLEWMIENVYPRDRTLWRKPLL